MVKKKVRSGCKRHRTAQVVGGQSVTNCSEYSTSCVKSQAVKGGKIMEKHDFPAIKGGCGHSDREVEHSAIAASACIIVGALLILLGIIL